MSSPHARTRHPFHGTGSTTPSIAPKMAQWRAIYNSNAAHPYRTPSAGVAPRPGGTSPSPANRSLSASRPLSGSSPFKLSDRPFSAFGSTYTGKPGAAAGSDAMTVFLCQLDGRPGTCENVACSMWSASLRGRCARLRQCAAHLPCRMLYGCTTLLGRTH